MVQSGDTLIVNRANTGNGLVETGALSVCESGEERGDLSDQIIPQSRRCLLLFFQELCQTVVLSSKSSDLRDG
jgi:hypothetical protein